MTERDKITLKFNFKICIRVDFLQYVNLNVHDDNIVFSMDLIYRTQFHSKTKPLIIYFCDYFIDNITWLDRRSNSEHINSTNFIRTVASSCFFDSNGLA